MYWYGTNQPPFDYFDPKQDKRNLEDTNLETPAPKIMGAEVGAIHLTRQFRR
jgi:hypothetical protein